MTFDPYAAGKLGVYGGIPVISSPAVSKDQIIVMGVGGARTVIVNDALRFGVRMDLHNYIERRVRETYLALGLGT